MNNQEKRSFWSIPAVQSITASILCIIIGLLIGFIVLLIINPSGASAAIITLLKNYLNYPTGAAALKYMGNTLVKTAPLLMCPCPFSSATRSAFSTSALPDSMSSVRASAFTRRWHSACPGSSA